MAYQLKCVWLSTWDSIYEDAPESVLAHGLHIKRLRIGRACVDQRAACINSLVAQAFVVVEIDRTYPFESWKSLELARRESTTQRSYGCRSRSGGAGAMVGQRCSQVFFM